MKEMAAAAGITAESQLANYYRWREPDSDITVWLRLDTVERLQLQALRGIDSFSRAEKEVGGILLGRTELDAGRILLFVDDFEPVPCDHRNGPFYASTAKDAANFEIALARAGGGHSRSVVGYYRSHNREGLFLSADDLRIIRRHFRGADNLFLLIKTLPNRACTAGFFFWKDGQIQAEFTDSEAPLIPVSAPFTAQIVASAGTVDDASAAPPAPVLPILEDRLDRVRSRRLIFGCAVASVAAVLIFATVRYREEGRAPHQAPRAQQPLHGKDGAAIPVANGRPAIPPPTPVRAAAQTISPKLPLPKTELPQAVSKAATPPGDEAKQAMLSPVSLSTNETAAVRSPSPEPAPPPTKVPSASSPASSPASSLASAERPPNIAPPSPTGMTTATAPPVTPPPTRSENPVTPASEPAGTDTAPVSTPVPPTPPVASAVHTFVGPRVVHQVTPAVPRGVGPMIRSDVQVDVAVAIDASGKVTGARIASTKGAAASLLTIEALKAAQSFRFQPAQENNRNVPSTMILTFRFAQTSK